MSGQTNPNTVAEKVNHEAVVSQRYSKAAEKREVALCCPVEYR
jgi:hypothetical protein